MQRNLPRPTNTLLYECPSPSVHLLNAFWCLCAYHSGAFHAGKYVYQGVVLVQVAWICQVRQPSPFLPYMS